MSDFSNPNWFSDSQNNNSNNGQGSGSPIDNPNYINKGSNDAAQQWQTSYDQQQYQQSPAQPDFLQSWQPTQNQSQPSYNTMPTPQTDQGNYGNPSYNPYQGQGQQANQWSGPSLNQMLPPIQPQHQQYQGQPMQHQFPVPQPAQWGDTLNGMMQQWQPPHQQQNQQVMLGQGYNQIAQQNQQTNNPNLMAWQHPSAWTRPGTQFNVYGSGENPSFTEFNANGGGPTSETDPNGAFGKGGWNIPRADLTGMSEEQAKQLAIQAGQRDPNTDFQVFNTGNGFNIATRGRTPGQGMPGTGLLPMPRVAPSMPAAGGGGGYRAPLPAARGYSGGGGGGGGGYAPRPLAASRPMFDPAQAQVLNAPIGGTDMNEEMAAAASRGGYTPTPMTPANLQRAAYAQAVDMQMANEEAQATASMQGPSVPYSPLARRGPAPPATYAPNLQPGWENNPYLGQYYTVPGFTPEVVGADGRTYPVNTPEASGA